MLSGSWDTWAPISCVAAWPASDSVWIVTAPACVSAPWGNVLAATPAKTLRLPKLSIKQARQSIRTLNECKGVERCVAEPPAALPREEACSPTAMRTPSFLEKIS